MKIHTHAKESENGSATLIAVIVLGLMAAFVAANTVTVSALSKQVKSIDQRQVRRLAASVTNSIPVK